MFVSRLARVTNLPLRRLFAERTYGGLKDSDRIFTNLYRDGSPWIDGALKRVGMNLLRETGTELRIYYSMDKTGSLTKSSLLD